MENTVLPEAECVDPIVREANVRFGIRYLYPYQRLVIANILDATCSCRPRENIPGSEPGEDAGLAEPAPEEPDILRQIVLLPTGYGKSLCFQLPASLLPGITLVVFPLRSLITDQERRMRERGIPCSVLLGGKPPSEKQAIFEDLRSGATKIVLASPEILRTEPVLSQLRSVGIVHAVIDEAHCVAEWGDDFRPAYADLGDILRTLAPRAVTAFTATASGRILARTTEILFGPEPYRLISGDPDRPNILYSCVPTLSKAHTLERLAREMPRPLLIFCASRPGTQITAEILRERLETREVRFYHAGMSKPERSDVESWFFPSDRGILVATCAFGMGLDKPNIRTVLHADPPPSVEAYLQESGRAGRDGRTSYAVLLSHPSDWARADRLTDSVRADRQRALLEYGSSASGCRRERLLALLGAPAGSCSGCDVCNKSARTEAVGSQEILRFVRANNGRFLASEAPGFLAGEDVRCAQGGTLAGWHHEDIREGLALLARLGDIAIPRRGLWKGRLRIGRRAKGLPSPRSALLLRLRLPLGSRSFRLLGSGLRLSPGKAESNSRRPAAHEGYVPKQAPDQDEPRHRGEGLPSF